MQKQLINWFLSGGGDSMGSGIFKSLIQQTNNGSSSIKLKLTSSHNGSGYGYWATGLTYYKGDMRAYPNPSPLMWKCITTSVTSNTSPDLDPTNWQLDISPEMIQDIGGGNFARTRLQTPANCQEPGWSKLQGFEIGTYADSYFIKRAQNMTNLGIYGASTTSNTVPSNAGDSRTFTIETGKALSAPSSQGSCVDTFSIPTITPTTMTRNLGTGLTLVAGDTLTFYANSTNMFVFVVATYNSTTGSAYGFTVAKGGSGSFSSWTVYKENLLYIFRDNEESAKRFFCTVQSYNSGTGVLTVTMIEGAGGGTGPFTNWAWEIGKICLSALLDSSQGTYFNRTPVLGSYIVGSFTGTGCTHNCQTDNRGVKWRYIYTGGSASSIPSEVVIDTYSSSLIASNQFPVFQNLTEGTHNYIAVAETGPVGSNTFAWVYFSTASTNSFTNGNLFNYDLFTPSLTVGFVGDAQAAGELIFKGKATSGGGVVRTWMPFHGDHAENNLVRTHIVDGVTINIAVLSGITNPYLYKYQSFGTCVLNQSGTNINEDQGNATIATYVSTHTLTRYGLEYYMTWTPAVNLDMDQAYSILVEMSEAFMTGGNVIAEDGTVMSAPTPQPTLNYMSAAFAGQNTYLARGAGAGVNYGLAWLYTKPTEMWRIGLANVGPHQFEWRAANQNGGGFKVRTYPIFAGTALSGVPIIYGGRFYVGNKGGL